MNPVRSRIYSLRNVNDKTELNFDLTGKIISETHHSIQLHLNEEIVYISKYDYLNKMKIWDNGKVFFIVCSKHVDLDEAKRVLLKHAVAKMDSKLMNAEKLPTERLENLQAIKERFIKEMAAA